MKLHKVILGFISAVVLITGCYDRDYYVAAPKVSSIINLQYSLDGDTVRLTWNLPSIEAGLRVRIAHTYGSVILENNPTSFNYGVIKVDKNYRFTLKVLDSEGNISKGSTIMFTREGAAAVVNLSAQQDETTLIVNWALPGESLSKIEIKYDGQTVELPGTATSYVIENADLRHYTFGVVTYNAVGERSHTEYLEFRVGPTRVAYLGVAASIDAIIDDDERASAAWFVANFPTGDYLTFNEIKNGADLSQYRVLWWHYDSQTGDATLPAISRNADVVAAITEFHMNGGGLLLNTHAVQYLWTIGRITDQFPVVVGAGAGGQNPDVWAANVNIGGAYDKTNHPIHQGLAWYDEDGRKLIPLIGNGWKEDHNYVIHNLGGYFGLPNNSEDIYRKLLVDRGIRILGVWGHVRDYYMMGNFETMPINDFEGTAIAIGLGSFEWNQNDRVNPYQENIHKITLNAIEYLKSR